MPTEPENKTVDEMVERLTRVQAIIAKGQKYGLASGLTEDQVIDTVRAFRTSNTANCNSTGTPE